MKKYIVVAVFAVLTLALGTARAEKVIAQHTVNQDVFDGYAVDRDGSIIKYSNAYSGGLLEVMTYVHVNKKSGGKEFTGNLTMSDFPEDTTDAQIVGLSRKRVLILYTDVDGDRIYATYKVEKNKMHEIRRQSASPNETYRFIRHELLSTINSDGKMTLQVYGIRFVPKKKKRVSGLGIVYPINQKMSPEYCDQAGTVGEGNLDIRVIKP